MELLKNSCRATADLMQEGVRVEDLPIQATSEEVFTILAEVIICADEDHVSICVADRARGIPRGANAWSYLRLQAFPTLLYNNIQYKYNITNNTTVVIWG